MKRFVFVLCTGAAIMVALAGCGSNPGSAGAVCGNGDQEPGEECDGADLGELDCEGLGLEGGTLACSDDCTFDTSQCTGVNDCGNGVREYPEQCDDTDLAGQSCADLGFTGGALACNPACTFDTSGCDNTTVCGDALVAGAEECDGVNLDGQSCASLGLGSGTLSCSGSCLFDVSGCSIVAECGNGTREHPEECDDTDLGGETCISQGFTTGTLACASDCTLDTSGCANGPTCGDDVAEGGEACDGSDLDGASCSSEGFTGGALACASDCTLDTSGCTLCGNDVVEGSEVCDGSDLASEDCISRGFMGGLLACATDCAAFDTSACVNDTTPVCAPAPVPAQRDEAAGPLVLSFTCTDADGDTLSVQATDSSAAPGGGVAFGDNGPNASLTVNVTLDPDNDDAGATGSATFDVTFTVADPQANTVTVVQSVTFDNPAPTFAPDPVPNVVVTVGQVAVVDITFTDPDGDTIGFTESSPAYAAFSSAGTVATFTFAPTSAADDSGAPDAVSVTADDGQGGVTTAAFTVEVNQVPIAEAGTNITAPPGSTAMLDGTGSSDPDGDPLTYLWTPGAGAPALDDPTSPTPSLVGGACNEVYTYTLVVNDGYVDSAADTVSVTMFTVGPYVSEQDCVPFDECGDLTRPWCTITGGVQAANANAFPAVYVHHGEYYQGTAAAVSETLDIDPAPGGADPEILGGYTDLAALTRVAAPSCDTSSPGATVIWTNTAAGVRFQAGTTNLFERFCVRSQAGSSIMARKANLTIQESSPHVRGNIVDATTGLGTVGTTVGIEVLCNDATASITPVIEANVDDPAAGLVFGGDGTNEAFGINVNAIGAVALQLLQNDFTGGQSAPITKALQWAGQGSLVASQNTLVGGDGATNAVGISAQGMGGAFTATLTTNTITGGTSTGVAVGAEFDNAASVLVTTSNELYGRLANTGTQCSGLRLSGVADAEVTTDNVVQGGLANNQAIGIYAGQNTVLRVLTDNEVSGGQDGGSNFASLQGISASLSTSLTVEGNLVISGAAIDPGTTEPYLGGREAIGINAVSVPAVTVEDNVDVLGGAPVLGVTPGGAPARAVGVAVTGATQLLVTLNDRLQGCLPYCGPGNATNLPILPSTGAGVLVQNQGGAGTKEISSNTLILGGPVLGSGANTVSTGVDIQERANTSGLYVSVASNAEIAGNLAPDTGVVTRRPQNAWGIRIYHAGAGIGTNPRIVGGRAVGEAIGVNIQQTMLVSTSAFIDSNGEILGNPWDDVTGNPNGAFGIRFHANGGGLSDLFVSGPVAGLQQIGGGFAGGQGRVTGIDVAQLDQLSVQRNRIWGGYAPWAFFQRGMRASNVDTECFISHNLIEACGVVDSAGNHHPGCDTQLASPDHSEGLQVFDGRGMPTFVFNNLVFGGFSQNGTTGVRVDDSSVATANVQLFNNYINAQGQIANACPAGSPDAIAIELRPSDGIIGGGAGLRIHNNIIDAGGRACFRYGVYEMGNGIDILFNLTVTHNVWVQANGDRDVNPAGSQTWGYRESTGTTYCLAGGGAAEVIQPTGCLNNPNAPTGVTLYTDNREGDPEFAGVDVQISEAPSILAWTDFHATASVLQANGSLTAMTIPPADDYEGDPRSGAVCDVGHDETP
ncbi:MAG: hypothetical protein ABI333_12555 [bacterium]